ncbi:MAG: radical SAM protein [Candidatus Aminicenantales bacterium]
MMTHVYGPVPSRRLGYSLGIDIVPYKTCSFDCVYCQLGRTKTQTTRRRKFYSPQVVLAQVRQALDTEQSIDFITFSGSGEPTLNTSLGRLIRSLKKMTSIPIAVLTNSSLLARPSVRQALLAADLVVPSLDAATDSTFKKVNRPAASVRLEKILQGLEAFRREFKGLIWLEVMLVKGLNDSSADLRALRKAIARIQPDRVQLNTVVRPPAEAWALPLSREELERIRNELGDSAEVVADFREKAQPVSRRKLEAAILSLVARRPVTIKELAVTLAHNEAEVRRQVEGLMRSQKIRKVLHKGRSFYVLS